MEKGEIMIPPNNEMRSLHVGDDAKNREIGFTNWHAVSAALEASMNTLSHHTLGELVNALDQLENMLPELNAEVGMSKDVLDLEKVGSVKKLAAIIFSRFFPEFCTIIRRAELREGAQVKLKNLERVREQLYALRQKLSAEIDTMLEMNLKKIDPTAYEECQQINKRGVQIQAYAVRFKVVYPDVVNAYKRQEYEYNYQGFLRRTQFGPAILLYEEITKKPMIQDEGESSVVQAVEVKEKMDGLWSELDQELKQLQQQRETILHQARTVVLEQALRLRTREEK